MDCKNRETGYFPGNFFNRSNRLTVVEKGIYYKIREGHSIGPFSTIRDAEADLRGFIRTVKSKSNFSHNDQKNSVHLS